MSDRRRQQYGLLLRFSKQLHDHLRQVSATEGVEAAPLTVTVQPQSLAELVGRQLSDRERDPVFTESIATAQVLAQSLTA